MMTHRATPWHHEVALSSIRMPRAVMLLLFYPTPVGDLAHRNISLENAEDRDIFVFLQFIS